ncbi:MAG: hypothetical protein RMI85_06105, partial [Candidatus Korarchaeum sp.]|nr:hypothetical protein [Candidatus Korarchaeum sp.]
VLSLLTYAALAIYLSPMMALLGYLDPAAVVIYLISSFSYASLSLVEVKTNPLSFALAPLALPLTGLALLQASRRSEVRWKGREYSTAEESAE